MRRLSILLAHMGLLLPLALAAGRPLQGAELVEIKISHVQRLIFQVGDATCCPPPGRGLDASPTFKARKDSTVRISIVDANPLLFVYTLKKGDAVQTSNAKVLADFASSLNAFVNVISPQLTAQVVTVETASGVPAESVPVPPDCEAPIQQLVQVGGDINNNAGQRAEITTRSLIDHAGAKAEVAKWNLADLKTRLKDADQALAKLASDLLTNPRPACTSVVALARTEVPTIRKVLDDLNDFAKLVNQIDEPNTPTPLAFTVDINQDQPIILTIAKSDNFPATLNDKTLFIGDTTFTVAPLSRVTITPGAGAVYSFVRSPTFSAVASGGQFVIKQTKNDYNKLDGAVMILLEPDALDLGPLNIGLQLGVSPKKDVGLFLGLSLRAATHFTLGAGVAFQRVDRLSPGLTVNQTIATQDQLKTEKTFRSGFYLHITVTTKKQ